MVESVVQSHAEIVVGSDEKKLIRVLHVDDEFDLLKVAKQCLELQGPFQVDTASSVEEALAKLEKEQYDAVVSDYQMPEKDGLEFLEMLRKNGNTIPFIIFTGKGREEVALRAWSLGGDHYVNKTGDPETVYCELAHCLRTSVEKHVAKARAEETIEKFEGLFRHNPEVAVYLDVSFKIVDVNPRFCQLFGYSAEEVKGRNINDVIVPEGMREEAEGLDKDAKNGYASHDTVRKRKDGSLVHVSISAAPVTFENKLLGYVGIYKDITELKRAQEESEESKKHFQMLFDLMADPVAVVDGRGKILEVTRKVEEITGFKREELVGKNLLKVKMFGAKTKAVMIKSLAKRMMGMQVEPYEVEVLKKDGGKLVYEINAAKIDYKGKPADLVVFRDISERKNLEEKLRVVGSLTRHDVRNKLSAVTGNAYLLKRKLAGNPEALEQLADMENAVRNVEAIFEFARTYEKLGVEQLVNLNVGKTVDEAVGLFPDLKGVKITNDCGGLTLLADSLLRQLFYNLIDDSLKYGEKLTQIRIRYEKSEDKLKLIYEDDGVGVSMDIKPKLFTEGFTTGKGSGYGLYLIKRMMDVYGWTINETGTHGKGAQFTINMPKVKPDGRPNYKLG
jgi:PAS domain S-box-containing protein